MSHYDILDIVSFVNKEAYSSLIKLFSKQVVLNKFIKALVKEPPYQALLAHSNISDIMTKDELILLKDRLS